MVGRTKWHRNPRLIAERDGRGKIKLDDLEPAAKFLDFAKGLHNGSKSLEEE